MYDDKYITKRCNTPAVGFHSRRSAGHMGSSGTYMFTHAHYHSDSEIVCIEDGYGEFHVASQVYPFSPGNIFLMNPYEFHYATANAAFPLSIHCIDFNLKALLANENASFLQPYIEGEKKFCNFLPENREISRYVRNICHEYQKEGATGYFAVSGNLFLLLAEIENNGLFTKSGEKYAEQFAKRIFEYIENNYQTDVSSRTAAFFFQYNHSYFCRLFRRTFGSSFSDFLNVYRIKKAKKYMENGMHKVSDIALECGFNNISYFSEVFKQLSGMTPSQYIKLNIAPYGEALQ